MKKVKEVYLDITREITHQIAERLKIPVYAHPKTESQSFVYNDLSCDLQIAKQAEKRVLNLEVVPPQRYYEQFVRWVESYFKDNKALKERPEFGRLREQDKVSRLERMLPIQNYHVNGSGLKVTYLIANNIDLVKQEGKKELADVVFDALRTLLLFAQKVR